MPRRPTPRPPTTPPPRAVRRQSLRCHFHRRSHQLLQHRLLGDVQQHDDWVAYRQRARVPPSIYANVSGLNSVPQNALVCPVVSIQVHDAASSNTTFNLAPTNTQSIVADVIDSNGVAIRPALAWSSNPAGVAAVTLGTSTTTNSATITANTAGTATVTATCATPNCNRNINPQYQQNVVTVNVSGTTSYHGLRSQHQVADPDTHRLRRQTPPALPSDCRTSRTRLPLIPREPKSSSALPPAS